MIIDDYCQQHVCIHLYYIYIYTYTQYDNGHYLMDKLQAFQLQHHNFRRKRENPRAFQRLAGVSGEGTSFQPGES